MKRAILCIFIFITLCALAAGSYLYIANSTERLINQVEFVAHSLADGDYAAVLTAAQEADEMWREFRKLRFLIIDRDNVAELTASLARLKALAYELSGGGEAREIITETAVATALLRQYLEHQRINLYNIL
jgi:HAMP domain-containing protein